MTVFTLYPGFVKIYYSSAFSEHTQVLPVDPTFSDPDWVLDRPGSSTSQEWGAAVDAWIALLVPVYNADVTFNYAELWTIASEGADPVFKAAHQIDEAGTAGGATVKASMATVSFRTEGGHNGKIVLVDQTRPVNDKLLSPAFGNVTAYQNIAAFLVGDNDFIKGRDGFFPVSVPRILTKTNDALRKKYNMV
jgi:hypothetical protein